LFLFVIMFLGVDRREDIEREPLKGQRPLALVFVAVSLGGVLALAAASNWVTGAHKVTGSTSGGHTDTYLLGRSIFTTYLWAFEITAALLVIAVVGAVVLARRPSRVHDTGEAPGGSPGATVLEPGPAPAANEPREDDMPPDQPDGTDPTVQPAHVGTAAAGVGAVGAAGQTRPGEERAT
jgi:NADH-quinone oxidoreductase subunit J